MLGRRRAVAAAAVALAAAQAGPARAAAGDLDPSFSQDGKVSLVAAGSFVARTVAVQPDGRILVAGHSCEPAGSRNGLCATDGDSSVRIARFTPDGGLDPEWGDRGVVTTPVGTGRSQAFDLLVQSDGRVVAGGVAREDEPRDGFALVRYDARGALDPSFGGDGMTVTRVGSGFSAIADLVAGPVGTIVAVGQARDDEGRARVAVARFTADGRLDGGFGAFGSALAGAWGYGYGLGGWIAPDGAVMAAGIAAASAQDAASHRTGVVRLTSAGAADAGFSGDGAAEYAPGTSSSFASAITALPDGRWLTAGAATDAEGKQVMALLRGDATGELDPSWDGDGVVLARTLAGAVATDVARLGDGRVLAAGHAVTDGGGLRFALARLDEAGRLDGAFGGGIVTTEWTRFPVARGTALTVDADGRALVAGVGCNGGNGPQCDGGTAYLALARYLGDPPPAEAPAPPAAAPDARAPSFTLRRLPRAVRRRTLWRRGLLVRVRPDEEASVTVVLRARGRLLARRELGFASAERALRLRPRRRVLPRRRFRATLVVQVADRTGNALAVRRQVRVR